VDRATPPKNPKLDQESRESRRDGRRIEDPRPTEIAAPIDPIARAAPDGPAELMNLPRPRGLTEDGRLKSGRLAGLTMGAAILTLSWPVLAESFLNAMVGLTDTVLSTAISNAAADAVSGAAYVNWFMGLVVQSLGLGATALIARAVGAGRLGVANAALGQSVLLALGLGAVSGAIVALSAGPAASMLSMHDEAREHFITYMRIMALGGPGMAMLFTLIAAARGAGDNLTPLLSMVVVNASNMFVSWMLAGTDLTAAAPTAADPAARRMILENPFSFDMGVAGIATGTLISYCVGTVFMGVVLLRGTGGVKLRVKRMKPHVHTAMRVLRVAFPNFLEMLGMWVGNFAIVLVVGLLGAASNGGALAAHMVAIRIEAFSFMPGFALGSAAATLVGQYLGAGSPNLAAKAVYRCSIGATVFMGLFGTVLITLGKPIVALLSAQPEHQITVPPLLFIAGWVQIPFALSIVFRSALRGAGDTKSAMWITWVTTYAIRMPMAWLLSGADIPLPTWAGGFTIHNPWPWDWGLQGLWLGLCGEIVIRAMWFAKRFAGGGWKKTRV